MAEFKALTFNMQYGQIWDSENPDEAPIRLDWTIEEIRSRDADIVLLQEVEHVEPEKGQVNPPPNYTSIRRVLPQYDGVFGYPPSDKRELPFGFGLAILSKTPLFNRINVPLPAPSFTYTLSLPDSLSDFKYSGCSTQLTDRVMIGAQTAKDGVELQIFNTHLQAFFMIDRSCDQHPGQREIVAEYLRKSRLPSIIGGDFNSAPGESTIEFLETTGFRSVQKDEPTWQRRAFTMDHLFYSPSMVVKSYAVRETPASDHHVVSAEFEV